MQYLCYSVAVSDISKQDDLEYKVQLCQDFYDVLNKIDPGWSELAMFAKRELHFYKLVHTRLVAEKMYLLILLC